MSKHVLKHLDWDQMISLACTVNNCLPNKHLKEGPFFLILTDMLLVP